MLTQKLQTITTSFNPVVICKRVVIISPDWMMLVKKKMETKQLHRIASSKIASTNKLAAFCADICHHMKYFLSSVDFQNHIVK
jgi:hypothetical protein